MWRIYDYKGVEKAVVHEVEYEGNHGGTRTLTCSISSPMPIAWEVTDLITYRDENFYLRHIPQAKKQARKGMHKEAFVYDNIVFYSAIDELASCDFLDVVKEGNNLHYTSLPNFSFYCETIDDIADRLQANLDRLYTGSKKWTIIVNRDPLAKTNIKPQALSFSAEKCSQVLERIYNDLGVTYEHTNRTITFGAMPIVMPYEFKYGKGKGLKSIEQSGADDNALVTRARVYGSTRNMPNRYYNKLYRNVGTTDVFYFKEPPEGVGVLWFPLISETMYVPNLMLPSFRESGKDAYIDATDAIAKYGLREGTKFFDSDNGEDEEIYPTIENMTADRLKELGYTPQLTDADNGNLDELLMVDDVPFSGVMPESGNLPSSEAHFVVYLKDIGFNLNGYLAGTPKISFRSGALAGREFDIVKCEKITLLGISYKLTCKRVEDTSIQLVFPYKDYKPSAGDKFVLLDIDMPEIYIKVAELRLKEEGEKWLELNSNPIYTYTPEIDSINILRNPKIAENLKEGNSFIFADDDLGISKAIRISNLKIKDNGFAPEYEITLSDKHTASLAEKVTQSVVDMIGTSNASVSNIKSLIEAYGNNLFLSKKKRDTADQVIRFSLGLEVGDKNATIDADGTLKTQEVISNNIHTTDFVQGALMGVGGAMYQLNGATYAEFDYLTARKGATFAELIIQEYRSIGGALVISQANGEIESIYKWSNGNGYDIYLKEWNDNNQFVTNDLVRCQYWDRTTNQLTSYWVRVVIATDAEGVKCLNMFIADLNGAVPQVGDKLVQMGNTTDTSRQGCILLTTENSLPRMAILDGINSTTLSNANYKAIYGSLDGFTDPTTNKTLSGYGMWGENVHLHGDLILSSTNKSVADSLKDVGNGRNLLLGTNNGTNNWSLGAPLYSDYLVSEGDLYNGYKGVHFKRLKITENAQWEVFKYVLRPEYIEQGKPYHISFDIRQGLADSTPIKLNFAICAGGSADFLTDLIVDAVKIKKPGEWQHCDIEFTPHTTGKKGGQQVVYFSVSNDTRNCWTSVQIVNLKLERGVEATEWSQAPEDAQDKYDHLAELANNAQTTADTAEEAAEEAKSNAYLAQLSANEAKERLDAWAEDGVISPNEKQGLKDELARIEGDYNDITDRFDRASLDSPSYYIEAYNAYTDMLRYLINESAISGKETTNIPEDFAEIQENYYQQKVDAYYELYDSSLTSAENAQSTADAIAQTTATLTQDIININNRLDGVVENWFYPDRPKLETLPTSNWTTAQKRYDHVGDTYTCIDESGDYAGKSWRWVAVENYPSNPEIDVTTGQINGVNYIFYWQLIADSDAIKALQQAKNAQDTADGKRRVFVAQPKPAYDEGDLWVKTENGVTTIYYCVTSKADGNVFDGNDWELASTDDSALQTFIDGSFQNEISNLQTQIDGKAETWYQESDPSKSWITDDLKKLHTGDMWYKTTTNTTYRWNGSSWDEQNIPKSVFDTIDGKAQIFVSTPIPPYYIGDLWVQGEDGDIMRCMTSCVDGMYNPNDWTKASKYTDDSATSELQKEVYKYFEVADGHFTSIQGAIINNAGQGRNILLGTNQGVKNWNLGTNLDKPTHYIIGEESYNDAKGVKFSKYDSANFAQWEVFFYPLRPQFITKDKEYRLSFDAKFANIDTNNTKIGIMLADRAGSDSSRLTNYGYINITIDRQWQHYDIPLTAIKNGEIDGTQVLYIYILNVRTTFWGSASFANLKLEEATIATPWSPAPEDAEESIKASETMLKSEIKQTADAISLKIKETEYFTTSNLIVGSYKKFENKDYLLATYNLADVKPNHGDIVTLSFSGKIEDIQGSFAIYNGGGSVYLARIYASNGFNETTQRYEITFTWLTEREDGVTAPNTDIRIYQGANAGAVGSFEKPSIIYDVMLTRTDKPVAYKPTPTDVEDKLKDTGIDIESKKITVTADNFSIQNNKGETTTSVDAQGNLAVSSVACRYNDGDEGTTPFVADWNAKGDGIQRWYYPNGNIRAEVGWDNDTESFIRKFDENGILLWKIGNPAEFMYDNEPIWVKIILSERYLGKGDIPKNNTSIAGVTYYKKTNVEGSTNNSVYKNNVGETLEYIDDGWYTDSGMPFMREITSSIQGVSPIIKYMRKAYHYESGKLIETSEVMWDV